MASNEDNGNGDEVTRRDFIHVVSAGLGIIAAGSAVWPLIDQMNPSADVLALASTEVDLSSIEVGESMTAVWRGKPVFIRRRTPEEIAAARAVPMEDLKDPERDEDRVQFEEWLIMVGVCTHLGCVPLGLQGDFGGWFCPCHGSHYDTSGRIRRGPAPDNMVVPDYTFVSDTKIVIG